MRRKDSRAGARFLQPATAAAEAWFQEMGLSEALRPQMARRYWAEAVGESMAAASQITSVREGTIFVRTKHGVWGTELELHRGRIIRDLNRALHGEYIKKIIVNSSGLEPVKSAPPPAVTPTAAPEDLEAIALSEETLARVEMTLKNITDQELRDHVRAVNLRVARMQQWKRNQGWVACPCCGVLMPPLLNVCHPCRLGIGT